MKNKVLSILVISSLTVFLGITFAFGESKLGKKNASSTMDAEQVKDNSSTSNSISIIDRKEASSIINFENPNGEKIYKVFQGINADEIIQLLSMFNQDSERIVVTSDGEVLKGKIDMKNANSEEVLIDTETDPNSLTVKELKELVETYKDEIDELASS